MFTKHRVATATLGLIAAVAMASWYAYDSRRVELSSDAVQDPAEPQAPPPLPRCARTAFDASQKTPDEDGRSGHVAARNAILAAYAGMHSLIHAGQQVDVRYPEAPAIRYLIAEFDAADKTMRLQALGFAPPDSPCQQQ